MVIFPLAWYHQRPPLGGTASSVYNQKPHLSAAGWIRSRSPQSTPNNSYPVISGDASVLVFLSPCSISACQCTEASRYVGTLPA